jgi:hypothetical protein
MQAHRLWINLWMDLGVTEENSSQLESNGVIDFWGRSPVTGSGAPPPAGPHPMCTAGPPAAWADWGYPLDAPFL